MNYEETLILNFLRQSPKVFFSRREIARRAVKRQVFEENPRWADAPIAALIDRGMVNTDNAGALGFKKSY